MKKIQNWLLMGALLCTTPWAAELNIRVGTSTRHLLYYTPTGLGTNRPLVISLHGMNQDAPYQQSESRWNLVADTAKFVVVYPNGISKRWDISGNSDVDFISAVIDTMYNRFQIDKNRVYLNGFSMGGMMTYHAANRMANKIAAFGPVSGYPMGGGAATSSRPIPLIHTHGTSDDVVTYNNVESYVANWRTRNKCPSQSQVTKPYPSNKPNSTTTRTYWGPCEGGTEVVLMTLSGKGHWWSNDANGTITSPEIWNFCKKYTLTGSSTSSSSTMVSSSSVARGPYSSSIAVIPGTIQAEHYDVGGEGVAYHDNDATNSGNVFRTDGVDITGDAASGYKIGWTIVGEWLEYTTRVDVAAALTWEVRVAAGGDGSSIKWLLNGVDITGTIAVPNTGSWDTYTTVSGTTPVLTTGSKTLRLEIMGSYANVDWIRFSEGPVGIMPMKPVRLKASDVRIYDLIGRLRD